MGTTAATGANVERSEEPDIFQSALEQSLSIVFDNASMPDDDSVEISGEESSHRRAECRAISNAESEKPAQTGISFYPHDVAVEEMIPAFFLSCKIEEKIRHDQRPTGNMEQEMLVEAWDACDGENLELPRPLGRNVQQWVGGEIHDLVEPFRCKKWNTGKSIASLPSVGVMEQHRLHQPGWLAQGPDFG
jgi:hypothetical protein